MKWMQVTAIGMVLAGGVQARGSDDALQALPAPEHWVAQARDQLLPWWRQPAALGQPVGRFPTFRCADGSAWNGAQPCAEVQQAPRWIRDELGRQWVRMQSRQVFAYAAGFHLTGDARLLQWARAGLDDMRARSFDRTSGSPVSWWQDGQPGPPVGERTAQDIAYAGLAWSTLYYLTRDPVLLDELDRLHRHLMSYYDARRGELRWTLQGPDRERRELVAQLDPLNAYMVLTTPLLTGERRQRWERDLRRLISAIRTHYCAGPAPYCHGTLGLPDSGLPGGRHNDFGHSGKALWMLGLAADILNDPVLGEWAAQRAGALLRQAYVPATGSWGTRWTDDGIDASKSWWIYAELDQLAATLALRDPAPAAWLQYTWPWWSAHMVDAAGGEVYGWVGAAGFAGTGLKQHQWKNGYHSLEHALVSYITGSALKGQALTLYFAPGASRSRSLQPYFFRAREVQRTPEDGRLRVTFRLPPPPQSAAPLLELPVPEPTLRISGRRVALTPAALSGLAGLWTGHWYTADEEVAAECGWTLRVVTTERIEAQPCAEPGATAAPPLSAAARLQDGALQWPGVRPGQWLTVQYSERDDQQVLQWQQTVAGQRLTVRLQRPRPTP